MQTDANIKPLTNEEILALPIAEDGSIEMAIYVSIPHFDNKVWKCAGTGMMTMHKREKILDQLAEIGKTASGAGPGMVRCYPEYIADRITDNGREFTGRNHID